MAAVRGSVVLLSGGMDSATCLALAARAAPPVHALTVAYGQRHDRERRSARALARHYRVARHIELTLPLGPLLRSSL
ncbi:secreted protein containing Queuosine synthesis-like domain protein, partial [mine drainage metagenome]